MLSAILSKTDMLTQFSRTELLYGSEAMARIQRCRVAIFGVGGVGGYVAEALARTGIGMLDLIDKDTVSLTNLNRQIIALHSTIGKSKVDVMKARILDIHPQCLVRGYQTFFNEDTLQDFDFASYDYVVDAIDTVKSKILLAEHCTRLGIPIIASMGAGNKLDPTGFEIADLAKTSVDPLAKVLRKELGKRGIKHLTVVYSKEQPRTLDLDKVSHLLEEEDLKKRTVPASNAFVPSTVGLIIASKVINDLCQEN